MIIQIVSIAASIFTGIVCGLVLLYLKTISQRTTIIENDLKEAAKRKDQCRQDFVDKVDYIREVTKLEKTQLEMLKVLSEIKGSMTVIEKMPQICGSIASQIVKQMNSKENKPNG